MHQVYIAFAVISMCLMGACQPVYEELPPSTCPKLLAHSRALLGEGIKDKSDAELLSACKKSSPKQRGCAMIATNGADIAKCILVRD
jgi:hypothetical protein